MNADQIFVEVNHRRISLAKFLEMDPRDVTDFRAFNLPGVAALPDLPACTNFWAFNLPGVAALPDLPACTNFWAFNLPGVAALPDLPACTNFRAFNLPGVAALPDLPACTNFWAFNLPGVAALPDLPACTNFWADNLPGVIKGGEDRDYKWNGVKLMGQWRVIAGCRNFSIADARKHWGKGGPSDRPNCLAFVEIIATEAARRDALAQAAE